MISLFRFRGYDVRMSDKIWANSADSHILEPADLWLQSLPARLAERAPRAERGDKYEILYIDGERIYAFGHRFLSVGSTDLPFARSEVLTLLPSVSSSFKISVIE